MSYFTLKILWLYLLSFSSEILSKSSLKWAGFISKLIWGFLDYSYLIKNRSTFEMEYWSEKSLSLNPPVALSNFLKFRKFNPSTSSIFRLFLIFLGVPPFELKSLTLDWDFDFEDTLLVADFLVGVRADLGGFFETRETEIEDFESFIGP